MCMSEIDEVQRTSLRYTVGALLGTIHDILARPIPFRRPDKQYSTPLIDIVISHRRDFSDRIVNVKVDDIVVDIVYRLYR